MRLHSSSPVTRAFASTSRDWQRPFSLSVKSVVVFSRSTHSASSLSRKRSSASESARPARSSASSFSSRSSASLHSSRSSLICCASWLSKPCTARRSMPDSSVRSSFSAARSWRQLTSCFFSAASTKSRSPRSCSIAAADSRSSAKRSRLHSSSPVTRAFASISRDWQRSFSLSVKSVVFFPRSTHSASSLSRKRSSASESAHPARSSTSSFSSRSSASLHSSRSSLICCASWPSKPCIARRSTPDSSVRSSFSAARSWRQLASCFFNAASTKSRSRRSCSIAAADS